MIKKIITNFFLSYLPLKTTDEMSQYYIYVI